MNVKNSNKIRVSVLGSLFLATVAFGALPACQQAEVTCTISAANFVSKLEMTKSEGSCEIMEQEIISTTYHLGGPKDGKGDPQDGGLSLVPWTQRINYNRALDAGAEPSVDGDYEASFGKFEDYLPDEADYCHANDMTTLKYAWPDVAADTWDWDWTMFDETQELAADSVEVSWKDVSVLVTPSVQGTYFTGEMTVKAECGSVTYKVKGFPEVTCDSDADCKNLGDGVDGKCEEGLSLSWRTEGFLGTCVWK